MYILQRAQACDRAMKWTEAFEQKPRPRPPVPGKENCSFHEENTRCRHDVVTQGGNSSCRKCIGGTSSSSSSQLCCVVSNDSHYSDELSSTKRDILTTAHDLLSDYQNRVNTASGESDFGKNLAPNRSRRMGISDSAASRSLCDVLVAEATSGLNDFCLRLCNENATTSAESETVELREVEGRSANGVVYCEESPENAAVSSCKAVFQTDRQLLT